MNKAINALRIATATPVVAKPEVGPRTFTATEIGFIALAALMASGIVEQKDVTGPKCKTFLSVKSWRLDAAVNSITGIDGHYTNGRGGKGPKKWIAPVEGRTLQGYYLKLAEDYLGCYGSVLETAIGKGMVEKTRKHMATLLTKVA